MFLVNFVFQQIEKCDHSLLQRVLSYSTPVFQTESDFLYWIVELGCFFNPSGYSDFLHCAKSNRDSHQSINDFIFHNAHFIIFISAMLCY